MRKKLRRGIARSTTDGGPSSSQRWSLTDTERGTTWKAETNDTGSYNLLRLPVGSYSVKVSKEGFQTALQPAFTLTLNQTSRVDVRLKVGQINETVEVTSAAPVLQTENAKWARCLIPVRTIIHWRRATMFS